MHDPHPVDKTIVKDSLMDEHVRLPESALCDYVRRLPEPKLAGSWGPAIRWTFHLSDELPPIAYTTAAFCVAVTPKGLVLTRTQRGVLEHLGGHREGNETVVATACREALEEGGLIVEHIALAAVRKVETDEAAREAPNRRPYPPLGFIPYFVAFSSLDLIPPNGLEVIDRVEMPILSALLSDSAQLPERQEAVLMIESLLAEKISKDSFNDETLTARLGTTLKKRGVCVLENGRESISNHIARDTGPHRHSR